MHNIALVAAQLQKQRAQDLMEEARIERFLHEKKHRDANEWLQRRLQRQRNAH